LKKKYPLIFLSAFLLLHTASSVSADDTYTPYSQQKASSSDVGGSDYVEINSSSSEIRCACENNLYRMLIDDKTAMIGIENKQTGYIWWSSPIDSNKDTTATPLLINQLNSSSILSYGIPEERNVKTLRSNDKKCSISVSDIENGIRVIYDFKSAGFRYPVEYTLENDHLKASLKTAEIEEYNPENIAVEITLLGSFGAGSVNENGYFVIPDGSGALINFNNGKTTSDTYSQRVYGADITAVPNTKEAVTQQLYLNMYGIVKENNALLVVASKGDSNARLNASVSKQSKTDYNICNFSFILRDTDTFHMAGNLGNSLTVFEGGKIKSDDIELLYYPISKENADYTDIAERYRNHLIENENLTVKTKADYAPLYVDTYGGTKKKTSFLGIPLSMKKSLTTFQQTQEILSDLKSAGTDNIVLSCNNWTNAGISEKIDYKAKPAHILGGKKDFKALQKYADDNNFELYPSVNNKAFYSGEGYYSFNNTTVRITGSYSRIINYDLAYGVKNELKSPMSLLSPSNFGEVYSKLAENYSDKNIDGVSLGDMTSTIYGDYGKKNISRYQSMNILESCYDNLNQKLQGSILADSANAYAFPYVSHIKNLPLSSSRFDIFDEDIPFIQLVLHGIIPYSTIPVNSSPDAENLILSAVSSGSNLSYDMIYEDISSIADTSLDTLFYANYNGWTSSASAQYALVSEILSTVSDCVISDYTKKGNTAITTYSDGTIIAVDFQNKTINFNGNIIELSDYTEKGGFTY